MTSTPAFPIHRALISVSDKTGLVDFARALVARGVEMMDGRLKTLHPKIHGGLLGRRGEDDVAMAEHGIPPIDLLVVNLYPFEATVAKPNCSLADAIENIDIGGPAMLRAAAKNHAAVTVVVDAGDYERVLAEMRDNQGAVSAATRFDLAIKVFEHTSRYDGAIANYLGSIQADGARDPFPRTYNMQFRKAQDMRYGENPHQGAAFYVEPKPAEACIATARQFQGKELSYNNVADTDAASSSTPIPAAWRWARPFSTPTTAPIKPTRPRPLAASSLSTGRWTPRPPKRL